ncbi:MAG: hypothetical protein KBT28_04505 [Bacteroidales bacterium]|nr:hypothetical protein [Candidatus Colimorpha merdihippi]
MSATAIGVVAVVIILASFVLRGEKKIRLVNLVGSIFLVVYAIKLSPVNLPLFFLGVGTVLVHGIQFWWMYKESKSARALAQAEARAEAAEAKIEEQKNHAKTNSDN